MKVRVRFNTPDIKVDEVVVGQTADDIVAKIKQGVVSHLGLALRMFVNAMSPIGFAQEVVRRYNQGYNKTLPVPRTSEEFLALGEGEGIVTVLER